MSGEKKYNLKNEKHKKYPHVQDKEATVISETIRDTETFEWRKRSIIKNKTCLENENMRLFF